jgi:hypothetical protein
MRPWRPGTRRPCGGRSTRSSTAAGSRFIDELYAPGLAASAREWSAPFRASVPDVRMEIIELISEGDAAAGHLTCSATRTRDLGLCGCYAPAGARKDEQGRCGSQQVRETDRGGERCEP